MDPIKDLLDKTGLSCDDLLQKLLAYKTLTSQVGTKSEETNCDSTLNISNNDENEPGSNEASKTQEDGTINEAEATEDQEVPKEPIEEEDSRIGSSSKNSNFNTTNITEEKRNSHKNKIQEGESHETQDIANDSFKEEEKFTTKISSNSDFSSTNIITEKRSTSVVTDKKVSLEDKLIKTQAEIDTPIKSPKTSNFVGNVDNEKGVTADSSTLEDKNMDENLEKRNCNKSRMGDESSQHKIHRDIVEHSSDIGSCQEHTLLIAPYEKVNEEKDSTSIELITCRNSIENLPNDLEQSNKMGTDKLQNLNISEYSNESAVVFEACPNEEKTGTPFDEHLEMSDSSPGTEGDIPSSSDITRIIENLDRTEVEPDRGYSFCITNVTSLAECENDMVGKPIIEKDSTADEKIEENTNNETKSSILKEAPQTEADIQQLDKTSIGNTASISRKRKSISDELVRRLKQRTEECEKSMDIDGNSEPTHRCNENDIEVCQVEDCETKQRPLLKLRADLFENGSQMKMSNSDDERNNNDEINSSDMREFMETIEEVNVSAKDSSPVEMRKIKMGFLKKRMLNEAIKHVNRARNYSIVGRDKVSHTFRIPSPKLLEETLNQDTQEAIRKSLKLQLSSLRNRKKSDDVKQNSCNKMPSVEDSSSSYKKHLFKRKIVKQFSLIPLAKCESADKISSVTSNQSSEAEKCEPISENSTRCGDDSLFSLSEDTNFMIIDVQGGVEFTDDFDKDSKDKDDPIKLTKTNDITKIKGWKNKKFEFHDTEDDNQESANDPLKFAKQLPIEENSNEELSPFVSNTLEEFLTENAKLNISYKIPKLGAEEGISEEKYKNILIPKIIDPPETEKKEKRKGLKAKTLAEKRRMLEGNKTEKIVEEKVPPSSTSYVLYNGDKVRVFSTSSNKCLANIVHKPPKMTFNKVSSSSKGTESKKPSLLELWHKDEVVRYNPGPLSKKCELQEVDTKAKWMTFSNKLPQVVLHLIPEVGKPVPPKVLHLLPKFGPLIENERLEFALSAVYTKPKRKRRQEKTTCFRIPVPYINNQKYILSRKRKTEMNGVIMEVSPERNTVESVLDDLITYVEHKENEDKIKEAEPYIEDDEDIRNRLQEVDGHEDDEDATKKQRRRRLNHELHRLNCKVVSVSVDLIGKEKPDCSKSYCKLGCVCRSLACTTTLPLHCCNNACMFECKCSKKDKISDTDEAQVLYNDAVSRIEDQAKRYLAKVEREFTQTLIHADDKTILVPSSDRHKTKRTKRVPKRYWDYLESNDSARHTKIKDPAPQENYNCFVKLTKINIQTVVPLCLFHNRYECSCVEPVKPIEKKEEVLQEEEHLEESYTPVKSKRRKSNVMEKECDPLADVSMEYVQPSDIRPRKLKGRGTCARVCGVHPEFVARNQIPYYKTKLRNKLKNQEHPNFIDITDLKHASFTEPSTDSIDVVTPLDIRASDRLKLIVVRGPGCHKRKQMIQTKVESESEEVPDKLCQLTESEDVKLPYQSIFEGEIVIPTNENKDFVKKLGLKTVTPYMRLLPWKDLLNNYYSFKISIWCSKDKNQKLLMNTMNSKIPHGYVDIRYTSKKTGLIMWILNKQLPKDTQPNLVHLILSYNGANFEISGICLKNTSNTAKQQSQKPHPPIVTTEDLKEEVEEKPEVENEVLNEDPNFLEHKNHLNELNVLCMTQHVFAPQLLNISPCCGSACNEVFPLSVELPSIGVQHRWRMLYLNSNFSFLSFVNNKYSIKYTDLMHILRKAQRYKKTICLQSSQLSAGYSQKNYGIYAVSKFKDRLFIGPYKNSEEHGIETLRYLRQMLVSTSYFEMVQGGDNPNNKKAVWLLQVPKRIREKRVHVHDMSIPLDINGTVFLNGASKSPNSNDAGEISEIDEFAELTPISKKSPKSYEETVSPKQVCEATNLLDSCGNFINIMDLEEKPFIQFPQFVLLKRKHLTTADYNRYIITNIPHFGYLGAIQRDNCKAIDVDWPFANKILRFNTVTAATEFLKRRFTNLLLPVPSTFQISLLILRSLNHAVSKPIDAKVLSGTHICGEFGVMDSRKLTPEFARKLGTTQEDVLKRLAKRAQYLGAIEINKLKEQEKILIKSKKELILKKQTNLSKYMELLMTLPEERRLTEYDEFRRKFNERTEQVTTEIEPGEIPTKLSERNDFIEITDSDDETKPPHKRIQQSSEVRISSRPSSSPLKRKTPMNSILIPKSSLPPPEKSKVAPRPIEGYKFVKKPSGKFILLKDDTGPALSTSLSGMKMTIRNSRIVSRDLLFDADDLLKDSEENNEDGDIETERIEDDTSC